MKIRKSAQILFLLLIIIIVLLPDFISFNFLLNFSHDDTFYYIKTAWNFASGNGSTFDGINVTNGYHPLWFLILTTIFIPLQVFNPSPEMLYRVVFIVHILLLYVSFIGVLKTANTIHGTPGNIVLTIGFGIYLAAFVGIRDAGMEAMLASALFTFWLHVLFLERMRKKDTFLLRMILLLLFVLTRTDYIYSIVPAMLLAEYFLLHPKGIRAYIPLFVALSIRLLYALFNIYYFGHASVVSSRIVSSFPEIVLLENLRTLVAPQILLNQTARISILIGALIFFIFYGKRFRQHQSGFRMTAIILCGGFVIFLAGHIFFNRFGIREWYMTFPMFVSGSLLFIMFRSSLRFRYIFVTASLIAFFALFFGTRVSNNKYNTIYKFSKEIGKMVEPEKKIWAYDWMGIIGQFSGRKVVCGDGFINSHQYADSLLADNVKGYLNWLQPDYYMIYSSKKLFSEDSVFVDHARKSVFRFPEYKFNASDVILEFPVIYDHAIAQTEGYMYLIHFSP